MLYNLFENRDFVSVFAVALLAEGVDRNSKISTSAVSLAASPSSRRAWIETYEDKDGSTTSESPSSRRAWIETALPSMPLQSTSVALLAEGVDRN